MPQPRSHRFPLLARAMGDWRSFMVGPATGLLQLLHPAIGAAVAQQSAFFKDPNARVFRSVPQIWATVLDADRSDARGLHLRDLHKGIRGDDAAGRAFHALSPETFWWAHATFTWQIFRAYELFYRGGLAAVDMEALYAETVDWYRLYRVNEAPVPPNYAAFRVKFARVCDETLEMTAAAERALRRGKARLPRSRRDLQKRFWREFTGLTLVGPLPDDVRARFGIAWSAADRARFEAFRMVLREGGRVVPAALNRASVELYLRRLGRRTRPDRYRPREHAGG